MTDLPPLPPNPADEAVRLLKQRKTQLRDSQRQLLEHSRRWGAEIRRIDAALAALGEAVEETALDGDSETERLSVRDYIFRRVSANGKAWGAGELRAALEADLLAGTVDVRAANLKSAVSQAIHSLVQDGLFHRLPDQTVVMKAGGAPVDVDMDQLVSAGPHPEQDRPGAADPPRTLEVESPG